MRLLTTVLGLALAAAVWAADPMVEHARETESRTVEKELPAWLTGNPHQDLMRALAEDTARATRAPAVHGGPGGQGTPARARREILVFVSFALGAAQLRDIYEVAAGDPDITVVFRGVRVGEGLKDFIGRVHAGLSGLDPPPNIALDPTRFTAHAISVAPAIVIVQDGRVQARVRGLADPAWLAAEIAAGRGGDRGARGPTVPIEEPDLIAEMRRRLAALDVDAMQRDAVARYWSKVRFLDLPEAEEDREREVDMSIVATRDIIGANGELVVPAGARLNPFDQLPFTARLVVFDATRPAQVAVARRLAAEAGGRRVRLIATRLDAEAGWQGLRNTQSALGAPVHLLTAEIRERFDLERVPAFVESRDTRLIVSEVKP